MKRILIVDDEVRIRETFADAFQNDYEVACARDGEEAIRLIKETKPDLVVLDWRLRGGLEGKDVLVFSKREVPQMPVCVVTASFHFVKEIKSCGADACFLKPCPDLLEKVKVILPP
jgi:DNA-binding response OmpR family regulator